MTEPRALHHGRHGCPALLEAFHDGRRHAAVVGEQKPRALRFRSIRIRCGSASPRRNVEPFRDLAALSKLTESKRLPWRRGASDPVALPLERVRGERDAAAPLAPVIAAPVP